MKTTSIRRAARLLSLVCVCIAVPRSARAQAGAHGLELRAAARFAFVYGDIGPGVEATVGRALDARNSVGVSMWLARTHSIWTWWRTLSAFELEWRHKFHPGVTRGTLYLQIGAGTVGSSVPDSVFPVIPGQPDYWGARNVMGTTWGPIVSVELGGVAPVRGNVGLEFGAGSSWERVYLGDTPLWYHGVLGLVIHE